MIDQENIEIYLLDFAEGNLSPQQIAKLRSYVAKFPEWQIDFEDAAIQQESFANKPILKRSEIIEEISLAEEWIIAELEGELSEDKQIQLEELRTTSCHIDQLSKQYEPTKLPVEDIQLADRDKLKKSAKSVYLLPTLKWAAAIIIIFFGVGQILKQQVYTHVDPYVPVKVAENSDSVATNKAEVTKQDVASPILLDEEDIVEPIPEIGLVAINPVVEVEHQQRDQESVLRLGSKSQFVQTLPQNNDIQTVQYAHLNEQAQVAQSKKFQISELPLLGDLLAKKNKILPEFEKIKFESSKDAEGKLDTWSFTFFAFHIDHNKGK